MECVEVIQTKPTIVAFIFEGVLLVGGMLCAYIMYIKKIHYENQFLTW